MKRRIVITVLMVLGLVLVLGQAASAQGPKGSQPRSGADGSGFTYQGELTRNGSPVDATCDFNFSLYDAPSGGTPLGIVGPLSLAVSNGIFTSDPLTFGVANFGAGSRFLEISVTCPGDSAPTILSRQLLTATPRAVYAMSGPFWSLSGNSGTSLGNFIGTTDNVSLTLKVNSKTGWRLQPGGMYAPNVIGGDSANWVTSGVYGATIGGGGQASYANRVTDIYGTVAGGYGNQAGDATGTTSDRYSATVGGGWQNNASGSDATVGGGGFNTANGGSSIVGGGYSNTASGSGATVGGGYSNTASGSYAMVGGGYQNTASQWSATVPGGESNSAAMNYTLAAGRRAKANHVGAFVWADSTNADFASTGTNEFLIRAGGGLGLVQSGTTFTPTAQLHISSAWTNSRPQLQVDQSTAPGRTVIRMTQAGSMGDRWDVASTPDWFHIYSAKNGHDVINLQPNDLTNYMIMGNGASLTAGGVWTNNSDRNLKANFQPLDGRQVLAQLKQMPISEWNYKSEDASVRHIGPTAQDFNAAFQVGADDTHISTVDEGGVALAALQGLDEVVQEKDAEITDLKAQVAALDARVTALEQASPQGAVSPFSVLKDAAGFIALALGLVLWGQRKWGGAK